MRTSGVLLHITSLPSAYGVGDLGPEAHAFVDWLAKAGQSVWQFLPLNPTDPALGNSPYTSCSTMAGNPLLISPEKLAEDGFVPRGMLDGLFVPHSPRTNYGEAWARRNAVLEKACATFLSKGIHKEAFETFCHEQISWLDDYALFVAIKASEGGGMWSEWPSPLRNRQAAALARAAQEHAERIEREKFVQYLFYSQYDSLKEYAAAQKVQLFGDVPIYVGYDSADVWANPSVFKLDRQLKPTAVSGVPPDYFSKTGQLWNTPVYHWSNLKKNGFGWWIHRLRALSRLYDIVRIDHFRGLVQYWEVPAGAETAMEGEWKKVPSEEFFAAVLKETPGLKIVAEDLGIITDDVREKMASLGFPGMRILLFAFNNDDPDHPYLPHNYRRETVVYTGTHDNNTATGWLSGEATESERQRFSEYTGTEANSPHALWALIRMGMMSVADTMIVPAQDLIGLGAVGRMNTPSTPTGNWE